MKNSGDQDRNVKHVIVQSQRLLTVFHMLMHLICSSFKVFSFLSKFTRHNGL